MEKKESRSKLLIKCIFAAFCLFFLCVFVFNSPCLTVQDFILFLLNFASYHMHCTLDTFKWTCVSHTRNISQPNHGYFWWNKRKKHAVITMMAFGYTLKTVKKMWRQALHQYNRNIALFSLSLFSFRLSFRVRIKRNNFSFSILWIFMVVFFSLDSLLLLLLAVVNMCRYTVIKYTPNTRRTVLFHQQNVLKRYCRAKLWTSSTIDWFTFTSGAR